MNSMTLVETLPSEELSEEPSTEPSEEPSEQQPGQQSEQQSEQNIEDNIEDIEDNIADIAADYLKEARENLLRERYEQETRIFSAPIPPPISHSRRRSTTPSSNELQLLPTTQIKEELQRLQWRAAAIQRELAERGNN
ncbi:hypothetical protein TrCOL_g4217 [Triparma columacea]|uniref:Uncharacterized protein n=1 Tax=Triparma columacea TaxID=722753 RepID=A0A9W7G0L0_9STRA|nr:hypothetical protein TrCOL_g4217 [Triparma columacea]